MLIIEGNAVYEVDCECLRRRWGRHQTISCEEDLLSKDQVTVQTGGVCREQLSYTGRGVTVAVLDTGLYPHPDFKERIVGWYDAIGKEKDPVDPNGHGTQEGGSYSSRVGLRKAHRRNGFVSLSFPQAPVTLFIILRYFESPATTFAAA